MTSGTGTPSIPEVELGGQGVVHDYNPLGEDYYTPNEFFQFHQNKRYDADRNLYKNILAESLNIYGTPMMYYVVSYNTEHDPIFGEDNDRRVARKFPFKAKFELPQEEDTFEKFGLEDLDNFEMFVSQKHFETMSQYDTTNDVHIYPATNNVAKTSAYPAYTPMRGDLIRAEYNDTYYEIVGVYQQEEMFLQDKHTWKFIVRVLKDETLNLSATTSASMTDISAVTNVTDVLEVNDDVDVLDDDILYTSGAGEEPTNEGHPDDAWY